MPDDVGRPLRRYVDHLESTPLPQLAADYVETFDHRRRCCLFLTYFAHGDTRKRGVALLKFKQTYQQASRMKGDASQNLIGLLERRLDMVVYRAKFTPTIWAARQLVSHGHVRVNGGKCNIASRRVDVGDEITLSTKAQQMALVIEAQSLSEREIPDYVVPDGAAKVTYTRVPSLDEVPYPVKMEPNLVVEFYSR